MVPDKLRQSTVFFATYIKEIQVVAVEKNSQSAGSSDVSDIFGGEKREAEEDAADIFDENKRGRVSED